MAFNGSLPEVHGYTDWILSIKTGKLSFEEIVRGGAPVNCIPEGISLIWYDLSGILACVAAIKRVTNRWAHDCINTGCDILAAALLGMKKCLSHR